MKRRSVALMNWVGSLRFCASLFFDLILVCLVLWNICFGLQHLPIVPSDGPISTVRKVSPHCLLCSEASLSVLVAWCLCIDLQTTVPVEEITKALEKKGFEVITSDDAGRFVCNYVYYHSLRFAEQNKTYSLFVHVPLFVAVDEETQMRFTASLLEVLASVCK